MTLWSWSLVTCLIFLDFYLANTIDYKGVRLEAGMYLMVERIIKYVEQLSRIGINLDPNTVIGTIFYHEYMHMLFVILGLTLRDYKLNKLSREDLEEVACEGLSLAVLPKDTNEVFVDFIGGEYLAESEIEGEASTCLQGFNIYVSCVRQLIDKEYFLLLPRAYPYRLVRNFFNDKEEIGWMLLDEHLGKRGTNVKLKVNKSPVRPRVFIVIESKERRKYTIKAGPKYEWRGGLIY